MVATTKRRYGWTLFGVTSFDAVTGGHFNSPKVAHRWLSRGLTERSNNTIFMPVNKQYRIILAGLLLCSACNEKANAPYTPAGWTRATLAPCCTVAIPPRAATSRERDAVDSVIYTVRQPGLSITLDYGSGGLPDRAGQPGWQERSLVVGGRAGKEIRYRVDGDREEAIFATIEVHQSHNDGNFMHLPLGLNARCKTATDCRAYEMFLRSFVFLKN